MLADSPIEHRVQSFYDQRTGYLGERSLYFNQGYWKDNPATQDAASAALAELLARVARLGPGDRVLDAGFGFGEQDLLWMERFGPDRIDGLNISPRQTEVAREHIAAAGLADKVDLRLGSATRMPFTGARFDKVVALECAHHFVTRQDFFDEAYRVLRPGGRIATTDIICVEPPPDPLGQALHAVLWLPNETMMPAANRHSRMEYAEGLRQAGFTSVRAVSIREHVYEPMVRHVARRIAQGEFSWQAGFLDVAPAATLMERLNHLGFVVTFRALSEWLRWSPESACLAVRNAPIDYVVATGVKPPSARRERRRGAPPDGRR
jgi:cyclopropane fatty-acyl-phospholipid synthase-like methyltransferase